MKKIFLLLLPFFFFGCNNISTDIQAYCEKVQFAQGQKIQFPDFALEYIGQKTQRPPLGPVYNFKIIAADEQREVKWSSGTGVIGPTFFEINKKQYSLELKGSKHFNGWLDENEMIVCDKDF